MPSFLGFVTLGDDLEIIFVTRAGDEPINPSAAPAVRVYGSTGIMDGGTGTATQKDAGTVTDATNAAPIVITSTDHGLTSGTRVTISGVVGNTTANTTATIVKVNDNSFSLTGTTGNGAYTSGGVWNVAGLYTFTLTASTANGYEAGKTYTALVTATVSGTVRADFFSFTVV